MESLFCFIIHMTGHMIIHMKLEPHSSPSNSKLIMSPVSMGNRYVYMVKFYFFNGTYGHQK